MKKIASDTNYKIFKSAEKAPKGYARAQKALAQIDVDTGAPPGAAHDIFMALQGTALIPSRCTQPSVYYGSIFYPDCESELTELLEYTRDALSGMKNPIWKKYTEGLFFQLYAVNEADAPTIIAFIAVRNLQ